MGLTLDKKIGKNSELVPIFDKKIGKNSELRPIPNKKIGENLFKELRLIFAKKISKNLNKKLKLKFIYNDHYLKKETIMLITETSSKVYKLKIYNKVIANLIHNTRWQQSIKKEINNLKIYHTWEYEKLLKNKKVIGYKEIFRIKNKSNKSIKRFKIHLII